ncbi:hypothetical protein L1987_75164 [Smallanthus sonchifolius]|uniref:Uncharacterized protein n=1 Tax=Smallanthus sonchifolius TaxID=185202 RepID=A0ACB9A941_9ASTR|nr:hypothetical protein L1987_75164 [Smallanthus sonchifolius]
MDVDPPVPPSIASKKVSKSAKKVSPPLLPKFTPKPPIKRKPAPILPKTDSSDADSESDQQVLRVIRERLRSGAPKVEKKSSNNATASHGAGSSRTHDPPKKDGDSKSSLNLRETPGRSVKLSSSTTTKNEDTDHMLVDDEFGSSSNSENEYKEPWDPYSYYPISLPLRPPGSGDPEVLNAEEFGKQDVYDETKINSALELGLSGSDDNENKHIILFQFPEKLPLDQVPVGSSSSFGLKDLPNGCIGKMLVYKSGAIKLKLGDTVFDVSSGTPCASDRSAAMMNTKSKDCCVLGKVDKRAIVTPDLNSILDNINLL